MKRVLELKTGLFPDAGTVADAVAAAAGAGITRIDVSGLTAEDRDAWQEAVEEIVRADLVLTL